jgi:transcriptional regulator with XRE-family HTH domain
VAERTMETRMPDWGLQFLPPEPETLGERIRTKRAALHLSQDDCAGAVGAGQNQWHYWERGTYFPQKPTLRLIADLLHESYDDLLALLNADEERRQRARMDRKDAAEPRRDKPAILVYPAEPRVEKALRILGQLEDLPGGDELAEHWVRWAEQKLGGNPGTLVPDGVPERRKAAKVR